jgi:hypothetical protein
MLLILRIILSITMLKLSCALFRTPATTRHKSDKVVVVVGGGAAGYFSAIECASSLQKMKVKGKVTLFWMLRAVQFVDTSIVRCHRCTSWKQAAPYYRKS